MSPTRAELGRSISKVLLLAPLLAACGPPSPVPEPTTTIGLPTVPKLPTPEATSTPTDEQVRGIKTEQSTQSAVGFLRNMRSLAIDDIKSLPDNNPNKKNLTTIIENDSLGIVMVERGENFWTPRQYTDGTGNLYALSSVIPQGETLASGRVEALLVEDMTTHKVNVVRFASNPENPNGVLGINQRGETAIKINDYFENGAVNRSPTILLVSPNDPNTFTPLSAENIDDNTWRANIQINYQDTLLENNLAMGGGELPGGLPTPAPTEAVPTPVPTVEPTTKPTEDSFVIDQNGLTATYSTKDGESILVTVPDGEGFKLQQEGDKLVLYHEGVYFGEFKPNVTVEGSPTGGWAAESSQAKTYLEEELAQIPKQKNKWLITLPIDIRETKNRVDIGWQESQFVSGWMMLKISFNGTLPLGNIGLLTEKLRVDDSGYGLVFYDQKLLVNPYTDYIQEGEETRYLWVSAQSMLGVKANTGFDSKFGGVVSRAATGPIYIDYGAAQDYEDQPITVDKILKVGNQPVFITVNP